MEWDFKEVCVVGLGMIGGSFALNLKFKGFKGKIKAIDKDPSAIEKGLEMEIIDEGSIKFSIAEGSDLVVIAVPVGSYKEVIEKLIPFLGENTIVSDLGSVKGNLVYMCEKLLKGIAPFVGGHPIAGTEKSGVSNAVLNLFFGAKFVITPTENTPKEAVEKIKKLWKKLGSEVIEMDPVYHDKVFASVSHLPHVVAYALVDAVDRLSKEVETDLFQLTGGGFKDFTRIAMSDPIMWRDICLENKEFILEAINTFKSSLEELETFIKNSSKSELEKFFSSAKEKRERIK